MSKSLEVFFIRIDVERSSNVCFTYRIIQAGRDFTGLLDLTPVKPGLRQIYAVFECDELHDVKGLTEVFLYAEGSTVYMG